MDMSLWGPGAEYYGLDLLCSPKAHMLKASSPPACGATEEGRFQVEGEPEQLTETLKLNGKVPLGSIPHMG